ncbi:hypothetical protein SUGI_0464520 [Cryptomeria japonica]|uniref:uncharacterized protein LOC131067109 n=1 Tax=Cryptomeria japonica TaxID=3369 RepID=UPI002408E66C|nr:uncharacterized protein LOC131067109 [Cryptomeria japonica]GLJ24336.1 hypothetical protein SUGI_0464520 [Cryptomeria japonica]
MGFIVSDTMYCKGKIHPCLESQSSVPKFLPETIITLSIALPPEDQEVLFYLIACSLNVFSYQNQGVNKGSSSSRRGGSRRSCTSACAPHRLSFECSCFECYMSFWGRWNESPNRDLIHKAIEIFEDHMAVKNGKKMKAKEQKLQAKQLITWLESNCDFGSAGFGKQRGMMIGHKEDSDDGETNMVCDDEGPKNLGGSTRMKEYMHTASGSERTFMRRMLPNFVGFFTSNLWTVWGPLDPCKA